MAVTRDLAHNEAGVPLRGLVNANKVPGSYQGRIDVNKQMLLEASKEKEKTLSTSMATITPYKASQQRRGYKINE
jgi:hypothetical protein